MNNFSNMPVAGLAVIAIIAALFVLRFLFAQKSNQKMPSRPTVLRIPFCRRIVSMTDTKEHLRP